MLYGYTILVRLDHLKGRLPFRACKKLCSVKGHKWSLRKEVATCLECFVVAVVVKTMGQSEYKCAIETLRGGRQNNNGMGSGVKVPRMQRPRIPGKEIFYAPDIYLHLLYQFSISTSTGHTSFGHQ